MSSEAELSAILDANAVHILQSGLVLQADEVLRGRWLLSPEENERAERFHLITTEDALSETGQR
jgi:hypothetical protein